MKVSSEIQNLIPYKPGKPIEEAKRELGLEQIVKLASNENALGPSPKVIEAIQRALPQIHLYPDPSCYALTQKVSKIYDVPAANISFGNGSDELIEILTRIYCDPGDSILISQYAFSAYKISASASRAKTTEVPIKENFQVDLEAMQKAWTPKHKIIFLANPNNPTGTYSNEKELDAFFQFFGNREDVLVVFDEAYVEFVRAKDYKDGLHYFKKFNNVICIRTYSKVYGLAGLRIGSIFAPTETIDLVNRVRKPFSVNSIAQVAAMAAFDDKDYVQKTIEMTWKGLDYFYKELKKMQIPYIESQGNFVLFDCAQPATLIAEKMLKKGVIVRPLLPYGLPNHLRLSVGLPQENELAMKVLEQVL